MGVNSCGTTLIDQGLFENIGAITWDTTVKTSGFTAVSGNGYFCNTTSAAFTVTLPSSPSAGDVVAIADYANTFDTNNLTVGRNGSKIQGETNDFNLSIEGLSITLIYVDGTQGWLSIDEAQASDISAPQFTVATGGTITTSGDFKIHTFTGPGTFCVSQVGEGANPSNVDHLVVAGGGGGGGDGGGAGGAGGFRTSFPSPAGVIPVSAQGYPITVGGGGAGVPNSSSSKGASGSNSVFSNITSAFGGGGGSNGSAPGANGGSGGGGRAAGTGGTGNTPPVSPPQGNNGGSVPNPGVGGAGGGGASAAGTPNPLSFPANGSGTAGGAGSTNSITGSSTAYSGGGGGGGNGGPAVGGSGGTGGGGTGGNGGPGGTAGGNGTANTGGGAGGSSCKGSTTGGTGGSGIVIIRYKFQ